jgi:uncharacterized Zn-binding protein involved in type VI secretion
MRRYTVTLGSPTSAGGQVSSAGSACVIDGVPVALEGDTVACPACRSVGRILCVGPRIPETWNGRHVALENDLCICRCTPSPRLLASQTTRCQVLKDTGHALSHPPEPGPRGGGRGRRLVLLDAASGAPLAHREYAVARQSGLLEFGMSDAHGQTHLLVSSLASEGQEAYDIYL